MRHRRSASPAACRRGERCMYFAFEESPAQLLRNMRSIGLDLEPYVKKGLLRIEATRPSLFGLEMHLASSFRAIEEFDPAVVVVDPITDFVALGSSYEVRSEEHTSELQSPCNLV